MANDSIEFLQGFVEEALWALDDFEATGDRSGFKVLLSKYGEELNRDRKDAEDSMRMATDVN